MINPTGAFFITVGLALASVAGDYFIKIASTSSSPVYNLHFLAGLLIYAMTAFGWVVVMPHLKLAYIGVVFSLAIVLGLCLLGVFFFQESLRPSEWLGVGLAIVSIILLHRLAG